MRRLRIARLDRLFSRLLPHDYWPTIADAWEPSWRPRGRWWMQARSGARSESDFMPQRWRRLTKPGRAA